MRAFDRDAAQGLGITRDLDRAEALIYGAEEGARLAPPHDFTSTADAATRETVGTQPGEVESPSGSFTVTRLDLVVVALLGASIALGAALILFAATMAVLP